MKRKLIRMKKQMERAGGIVHVTRELPDDIIESFFNEVLKCPDCAAAIAAAQARDGGRKDH